MSPSDLCVLPKEKVKELQSLFAQAEAIVKELERHNDTLIKLILDHT